MKRVDLSNMPEGKNVTPDQKFGWVRDALQRIALASRRDDDLNALTTRVATLEAAGGGTGDVVGPASAVDGEPAVYNGTTGKLIKDITFAAFKGFLSLVKGDVGLGNVDNTSDANKPVSTAQQAALNLKANLASPTFTGTVGGITAGMVGLGNVDNTSDVNKPVSTAQQSALDLKAPLASPALTGSPTAPTAAYGDASTLIANDAFVAAAIAPLAPLASPVLTGIPTAPTLDVSDDSDAIATTAFVHKVLDNQATFDPWQVATVPADSYRWGQV